MARLLFDTDVLIDHLRAKQVIPDHHDGAYSSITRAELYSYKDVDEAVIDRLLSVLDELPVSRSVAEEAGRIRRTVRIKLPDAIIAATAILSKRRLMSRNVRDFGEVPRLQLYQIT
ncbi:MAG: type II toxin-antitoxin system VapC family toxin [Actinomycetota bacterium]